MEKMSNSMVLCIQESDGWPLLTGGRLWHVMGVDCTQYEYHCNTPFSVRQVEHSSP